jgi:very-short-patch-repair endonuclease
LLPLARCLKQTPPSPLRGTSPVRRGKKGADMRDDRKVSGVRAKEMRQTMSNAEVILWSRLRRKQVHGVTFRRQHPIGPFIADFACWEARLVIEVDGPSHVSDDAQVKDKSRTEFLNQAGWEVLRVWNNDVYNNLHGVMDAISIRVWENMQSIQAIIEAGAEPFLPPSYGGSPRRGMGVFSPDCALPEAITPSDPSGHLPRGTGEENCATHSGRLPLVTGEEKEQI